MLTTLTRPEAQTASAPGYFEAEARRLVADLHTPRPVVYWTDLFISAGLGWGGLAGALWFSTRSVPLMLAAMAVSAFAFYRGLCFVHEITHVRAGALPGFETGWNALIGIPMLMPSTMYVGVHQDHHKLSTYGTENDPEYLPFGHSNVRTALFTVQSLLIPVLLIVRGVILVPFELAIPALHRWLVEHASSLSMNPRYRRVVAPAMSRRIKMLNAVTCITWLALASLAWQQIVPWHAFAIWYGVMAAASFVNTLRTLAAHTYDNDGTAVGRREQLTDSIDVPGAAWTELWAPVGLRYHALHHYFPGVPYHNMGKAYRRLAENLPEYRGSTRPGLLNALAELYRRGKAYRSHEVHV